MRRIDRTEYDFRTDTWVRADFLSPEKRSRPDEIAEPATPPASGRWTGPIRKRRPLHSSLPLISILPCLALAAVGFWLKADVLYLDAALLPTIVALATRGKSRPEDRSLFEDPDDPDVCLVVLKVWRNGLTVGTDRGVAWFEEGRLLFNGHRTSFALGGEDVLPRSRWAVFNDAEATSLLPTFAVPLRLPRDRAYVLLTPISSGGAVAQKQETGFLGKLYEFRRRPPHSRGPRQWPPLSP